MRIMSNRLRRLFSLLQRWITMKRPLPSTRTYQQGLSRIAHQIALAKQGLSEGRKKLDQHAERLNRLAQRYDDQARKHYKLQHRDLAEAAIQERVKDQVELRRWGEQLEALAKHLEILSERQARLEQRDLPGTSGFTELAEFREDVEAARADIHRINVQLEATAALEDGEVSFIR